VPSESYSMTCECSATIAIVWGMSRKRITFKKCGPSR
jgi:hypothetical protein